MDVVSLAAELVRIPSMNPMGRHGVTEGFGEARLRRHLAELLVAMGGVVTKSFPLPERPNITAFFDFGARETVLFEAHLDTVPAGEMTVEPFGGVIRDDRLYGRGSCDVKGPMAAMIAAIESAKSRRVSRNVLFVAVVDEEYQFTGVRHLLQNDDEPRLRDVTFAVVAEPTDLEPVVGHKGVVRWVVETRGTAAHSSTPELGDSAIYSMSEVVLSLCNCAAEMRERTAHPQLGVPTLSVGTIAGGTAVNIVPDYCRIEIDRRLVPGESIESATRELQSVVKPLGGIVSAPIMAAPPLIVSQGDPAARAVLEASKTVNPTAQFRYVNYCTDATFYGAAGIPSVVFGPGSIRQAHAADEWISTEQLRLGVDAYLNIITNES